MGKWIEKRSGWLPCGGSEAGRSPGRPKIESEDYGVRYIPVRCPRCRSKDVKCYSSHPPIRYHLCVKCGKNFKSVEANDEK